MTNEEIFNDSTFDIYRVGPSIARIVSILEEKNYVFKLADYHAVLWDWNEMYVCSEGSINETGYVLSREKEKHPTFAENICLSYTFDSPTDDDTICIGLNHFKHPYKNYPEIVDGKITFYNNANERQLDIIHQDAVYAFIDYLIEYKKTNNKDLKESEIANLLKNYLKILLENNISLKREKNV